MLRLQNDKFILLVTLKNGEQGAWIKGNDAENKVFVGDSSTIMKHKEILELCDDVSEVKVVTILKKDGFVIDTEYELTATGREAAEKIYELRQLVDEVYEGHSHKSYTTHGMLLHMCGEFSGKVRVKGAVLYEYASIHDVDLHDIYGEFSEYYRKIEK